MENSPEPKKNKFVQFLKSELTSQKFNAVFGDAAVSGHKLSYLDKSGKLPKNLKFDTKGLTASIKTGIEMNDYVSKAAVGGGAVAGAILFGPLGAVAGGLLGSAKRKGGTQIYIVVERDGEIVGTIEGSAKKEREAKAFVAALEASAADQVN